MGAKRAILDPKKEVELLEAADVVSERPAIWLMMKVGMHPENLLRLKEKNIDQDEQGIWLQFNRVKNAQPRRELLPNAIGNALIDFLLRKDRPKTRQGYWVMTERVGRRIGLKGISPMTLRHTACVNFLRQYRDHTDRLKLVAVRMGCSERVVIQNYMDMEEWERTR